MSYADIAGFRLVEPAEPVVIPHEILAVMDQFPEEVRHRIASGRIRFEVFDNANEGGGKTIFLIHDDPYSPERVIERLSTDVERLMDNSNAIRRESARTKFDIQETMAHIEPFRLEKPRIGRNQPCPCGNNMKYKFCCMRKKHQ